MIISARRDLAGIAIYDSRSFELKTTKFNVLANSISDTKLGTSIETTDLTLDLKYRIIIEVLICSSCVTYTTV